MNEEIQETENAPTELHPTELHEEEPLAEIAEESPANEALPVEAEASTETLPEEPSDDEFPTELDSLDEELTASEEEPAAEHDDSSEEAITATREELKPVIESLLFVADEPLPFKQLCKVLGDVPEEDVQVALEELAAELENRNSGLEIREIAGGWRFSTRPQNHEFIRKYLKSRPSARLSLPALETLAVIAYKQPITVPEILEIRGVTSSSAIKTLLEKRLIVTKGRKETVGRPMMYGTSKEFLIQFGLKDLNELPSFEDFEDLVQ
ncbi:MAG: SMC-Scp complex subunit ScpB [Blastocatellia bacterium]